VHGFSQSELDRAKAFFLGRINNRLEEKDNTHRKDYIESFIDNYINGGDLCGFEESYELLREIIQNHCTADDVNQYIAHIIKPDNVSVVIAGPKNEQIDYPTQETVTTTFQQVFNSVPEAYTDTISMAPLMSTLPEPGIITNCETTDSIIYSLTLGNGAKVLLMPTSCKNDEILVSASSDGGFVTFGNQHSTSLRAMNDVIEYSALGGIPYNELTKRLINTNLSLVFYESAYQEEFSGNSGKSDLETLFQILYLYFTDIRKDLQTFKAFKDSKISEYRQSRTNPTAIFADSIIATVYPGFPYAQRLTEDELNALDYDEILAIYKERVANPGDYLFTIVGNFTIDGILPLIESYIASIPDNGKRETKTIKSIARKGTYVNHFTGPMLTPKTSVEIELYAPCAFNVKNSLYADMLTYTFDYLINNEIREKKNSSYGASVQCKLEENSSQLEFKCIFDTNNDDADDVYRICREVIDNTLRNGVTYELFCDIFNQQVKYFNFVINSNNFWQYHLYMMHRGYNYVQELSDALNGVSVESYNQFIQSLSPVSDLTTIMKGE
jgi:zinc protease